MNRILALCSLLLLTITAVMAQPPDTMWTHAYGGINLDDAYGAAPTSDGGFYIVGRSRSFSDQFDVWLVRIDSMGDTLWTHAYGGAAYDQGTAVRETSTGGALVAGRTQSYGAGADDIYLIKTDADGDTLWTRTYGTSSSDFAYSVTTTLDGGYVVAGSKLVTGLSLQMFVMKFSASDVLEWERNYGGSGVDEAFTVCQTADGGYLLGGRTVPPGATRPDMYAVRINAQGDTVWTHRFGNDDWEEGTGITESIDGGCVLGGWKQAASGGGSDFYVVKTTNSGALQWEHTFGGSAWERASSLKLATDGGYIVGGTTTSYGAGSQDYYFVKINTSGDTVWTRTNGGGGVDYLYDVQITSDGGYIGVGSSSSFGHGGTDFYAVRLPGFSGVGGYVSDFATGDPLPHVWVGAIGQAHRVMTDQLGYYVLTLPPGGTYDIITYGGCVARDTAFAITVFEDSITALNMEIGIPVGVVPQTSLNIVAHNHVATSDTLRIYNPGLGILDFHITIETISPPTDWLSLDPASGSIDPGDSMSVAVIVLADTSNNGAFDFYGELTVHMNSCPDSAVQVNVIASILDADNPSTILPTSYSLAAYPNPFNPATSLSISLPLSSAVKLSIYDILGREVRRVVDGSMVAGTHRVVFDASDLPSGFYIARLQAGTADLSYRLLLMK